MAEETQETPSLKKVREAEAEKLLADAAKAKAEAALAEAKAEEAKANAEEIRQGIVRTSHEIISAKSFADIQVIEAERKVQERAEELAANRYNNVYYFNDEVSGSSTSSCMKQLDIWRRTQEKPTQMELVFTSPGGSVIAGMALFDYLNTLKAEGWRVVTGCRGYAASMAGILLQVGDERWMGAESYVLIHQIATLAMGKIGDIEDEVKFIHKIQDRVLDIFAARCKAAGEAGTAKKPFTKKELAANWERKDWWLSSTECLNGGLVDILK